MSAKSTDALDAVIANFPPITLLSTVLPTGDLDLIPIPPAGGYGSFMPG
jgi:hypothetical protein